MTEPTLARLIRDRLAERGAAGPEDVPAALAEAERLAADAAALRGRLGPGDAPDVFARLVARDGR